MKTTVPYLLACLLTMGSCYAPKRDCTAFKEGSFQFSATVDGKELTTTFTRTGNWEVDYFEGRADTSSVRWINDCEYILKKKDPRNMAEEKSVHMKILSTTDSSYTFEYGIVGEKLKSRGTAVKIDKR
ncbi:MAG: DNA topoisomerase IV [Sediminicola sp.]